MIKERGWKICNCVEDNVTLRLHMRRWFGDIWGLRGVKDAFFVTTDRGQDAEKESILFD